MWLQSMCDRLPLNKCKQLPTSPLDLRLISVRNVRIPSTFGALHRCFKSRPAFFDKPTCKVNEAHGKNNRDPRKHFGQLGSLKENIVQHIYVELSQVCVHVHVLASPKNLFPFVRATQPFLSSVLWG